MSSLLQRTDEPGDAELISAVRGGDVDAYGELFTRHVEAARRLGRQLVSAGDVDDLVSEAFAKVLVVMRRGGGPDLAFRAYLLTAVRRLHVDRIRANARLHTTDDLTPFDPGVPFRDTAVEGFESAAAARAFASLPERWQMVLWHTEVEGQKPAEVAPLLAMSANSVAALAYRAREGLRQAFLEMHLQEVDDDACRWTHRNLGAYIRNGISRRDATRVERHLEQCRPCTAVYLELTEVNSNLSGILAPLVLGGAAAAYVGAGAAGVAVKGGLLFFLDRARDVLAANAPATAIAGVAATLVVSGAVFVTSQDDRTPAASPSAARPSSTSVANPGDGGPADRPGRPGEKRSTAARAADRPAVAVGGVLPVPGPGQADPAPHGAPAAPGPTDGPSPSPAPPAPTPEPGSDLHLTARATSQGPATYRVLVSVTGAGDEGALLAITGRGISVLLTPDPHCDRLTVRSGSCRVDGSTATFSFTAVAPLAGAALVFTATGGRDPDRSDNRVVVPLGR